MDTGYQNELISEEDFCESLLETYKSAVVRRKPLKMESVTQVPLLSSKTVFVATYLFEIITNRKKHLLHRKKIFVFIYVIIIIVIILASFQTILPMACEKLCINSS